MLNRLQLQFRLMNRVAYVITIVIFDAFYFVPL